MLEYCPQRCDGYKPCRNEDCELYNAIKSLEKQIPQKPTSVVSSYYENETRLSHGYCPICKTLNISFDEFCGKCGQALDWS